MRVAALIGGAALVVAACGGGDSDKGSAADPPPAEVASDDSTPAAADALTDPGDAPELLRFTAPLVGGGEIDATTTAGTPTAFWFWSPT